MTTEQLLFWIFGGLSVASALGVVLNVRSTINAALCLVVTMVSLAVLFVMLHGEFVGVLQILVYAGAIVVLFVFVIMLLNLRGKAMGAEQQPALKVIGSLVVLAATAKLGGLLAAGQRSWAPVGDEFGSVRDVALVLYTDYVLAVWLAGVLLTAGIVSAVVLAKRSID
jgi:NADH-quinone oxidoreductase subunit J